MVDRFDRLRHHAVVGCDDQDRNVGRLRTTGTHCREGGVAGRIDEGDLLTVLLHLIGADMLGDATGFAGDYVGMTDGVEQRGLAVVDMAHDGNDGRARNQFAIVVGHVEDAEFDVGFRHAPDRMAEFAGDDFGKVGVDDVARLHHLAFLHQVLDDVDGAFGHALRQLLNGDGLGQNHLAGDFLAGFLHLTAAELLLPATHRRERTTAGIVLAVDVGSGDRQLAATALFIRLRTSRDRLCGFRANDAATDWAATRCATIVFFLFVAAAANGPRDGSAGCRTGSRCSSRIGPACGRCRRCGLLRPCHVGACFGRSRFCGCRFSNSGCLSLPDSLFSGPADSFFRFGCLADNLFGGTELFFLGAADRILRVTRLGVGKRAAAGVHLFRRQMVQHHRARTIVLARRLVRLLRRTLVRLVVVALLNPRCRRRLLRTRLHGRGRRFGCAHGGRRSDGRDRLFVFRAHRAPLTGLDDDRLGATSTHILANGTLAHPRWFQGECLFARYADCLVVVTIGHSFPFLRTGSDD